MMRAVRVPSRLWLCAALSYACGCHGKHAPPPAFAGSSPPRVVHADEDAGPLPGLDAGHYDVTIDSSKGFLCGYDRADLLDLAGNVSLPELSVATDERGFALLFHDDAGALYIEAVPVDGAAQDPVAIVSPADEPAGASISVSGAHFLIGYRDQDPSAQVLRVRELSSVDHAAMSLSSALVPTGTAGELWASVGLADGFLTAFVERAGGATELRLRRLHPDGTTFGDPWRVPEVGGHKLEDLHLAPLDAGKVLLGWLERDDQGNGHVMAMPVASDGSSQGQALELSKNAVHDAPFDLRARKLSAGLLYHSLDGEVRDALKYRRIDASGMASQPELNIESAPARVRDGSIADFGQGYVVAYRGLPSLGVDHAAIHVAFINQYGEVVYRAELSPAAEAGGRTAVASTADGHLLVAWNEQLPSGAATHALKLYCPGALVLCGGKLN